MQNKFQKIFFEITDLINIEAVLENAVGRNWNATFPADQTRG